MPYINNRSGEFGISMDVVRQVYPNVSIPYGFDYGEYSWYEPSEVVFNETLEYPEEISPENGVQKWKILKRIPTSCTPAQGERALFDLFQIKNSDVLSAINQIENQDDRYRALSAYSRSTEWRRDSETTQTLSQLLSLTKENLDQLYEYAVQVNV